MVNKVILVGRLGQDPQTKQVGEHNVCNFSVATTDRKKETTWHDISVWGAKATSCGEYLKKGSLVYVEGSLQKRSYEKDGVKRYVTSVNAYTVQFLDTRGSSDISEDESAPDFNTTELIPF